MITAATLSLWIARDDADKVAHGFGESCAPFTEITDKHLVEFDDRGHIVMLRDRAEFLAGWPQAKADNMAYFGKAF